MELLWEKIVQLRGLWVCSLKLIGDSYLLVILTSFASNTRAETTGVGEHPVAGADPGPYTKVIKLISGGSDISILTYYIVKRFTRAEPHKPSIPKRPQM